MAKRIQKPVMASFGAIVAERRRLLGITQEILAERVGIYQESLSRMEQGVIAPRFERLQLFADALECSIADLFRVEIETSEVAAMIEQMLSPLSNREQKEIIEVIAKIITLIAERHAADNPA